MRLAAPKGRAAPSFLTGCVVAIAGLLWATGLGAQTPLPGPAQSPQLQERFRPVPMPPEAGPGLPLPSPTQPIPPGAETAKFRLSAVQVQGVTVYSPETLQSYYADLIGTEVSLAQMVDLANRLTARYRADGYILGQVVVPAQTVNDGRVTLVAVEGFIDRVLVEGDVKGPPELLELFTNRIRAEKPLTGAALERNLLLIGDLPGVNVQGILEPSPTTFGAADLRVVLRHRTVEGFVSLDNRGSRFVGPWTLAAGGSVFSLLGGYEQFDFLGATTPGTGEFLYGQAQVTVPLRGELVAGDTVQFFIAGGRTRPDIPSEIFPFDTRSKSLEMRATYFRPVIRTRSENLSMRLSGIWRDNPTRTRDLPRDDTNPSKDQVRLVQLRGTYDITDRFAGVNLLDIAANQGLDILGASEPGHRVSRQTGADSNFTYFNLTASRLQGLGSGFSVFFEVNGQYSMDPLLPSERFGIGGVRFGRGFPPGDVTGDRGIAAKIEPRYGRFVGHPVLESYQAYIFADAGRVWDIGDTPHVHDDRVSVGIGVRLNITEYVSLNPELAQQVVGKATDQKNREHETRFLMSLVARF